jgi:hypothetical protein
VAEFCRRRRFIAATRMAFLSLTAGTERGFLPFRLSAKISGHPGPVVS